MNKCSSQKTNEGLGKFSFAVKLSNLEPPLRPIGQPFIQLQEVDSTNNYATALLHEGMASHGTVVFAHRQTAGKGQRNRSWLNGSSGLNIAMTVVVQPFGLTVSNLFLLSMASAVAIQRVFSNYAGPKTKVKWPNDLYWGDRKAAGILIENSLSGTQCRQAIIGIGMNINQPHMEGLEDRAVSLTNITGQSYDVLAIVSELCRSLNGYYELLFEHPEELARAYQEVLYKRDEPVRLKRGIEEFETIIKGVTPSGQLITANGAEAYFSVGEVEWHLPQ